MPVQGTFKVVKIMDDSQFETLLQIEQENSIYLAKIADALETIAKYMLLQS